MSKPNPQSGQKRARSSEHSDGELEYPEKRTFESSPDSASKLTVPLQPSTQLDVSTAVQEPNQASRISTWIADSQEQPPVLNQSPTLSESNTNLDSQRLSLASGATSKTAPLTKQNLKLLRQQTMPATPGKATEPSTSKKSTAKTTSSSEKDLWNARRILALNGMHIEKPSARARYPQVADEVGRLLIDRNSEKKRNIEHLKATFEDFELSNEITLEAHVMPLLQGIERSVTQQDHNGEPMEVQKSWLKDRLGDNWDFQFVGGVLQTLKRGTEFEQEIFDAILEKYPKLKNPKPDIIYGPWASAFSEEEQFVNEQFIEYSMVSESLYHSAFIWEWKSAKGNLEESILQACRATAAIGYAIRNFQRCIGINPDDHTVDNVDLTSLVYAMCIDNRAAYMYAGFYVREGASVVFRFVPFRDYPFYMNATALSNLRQDVHNVLDWIVGERLNWIKRIIGEYLERKRAKVAAAAESGTSEATSPSGSHVNKRQRTGKEQAAQTDG